jgi:hypothetical protein
VFQAAAILSVGKDDDARGRAKIQYLNVPQGPNLKDNRPRACGANAEGRRNVRPVVLIPPTPKTCRSPSRHTLEGCYLGGASATLFCGVPAIDARKTSRRKGDCFQQIRTSSETYVLDLDRF